MDPVREPRLRQGSVSAPAPVVTAGKTPLERMYEVVELSRRGRLIEQLADHGRANEPDRAR